MIPILPEEIPVLPEEPIPVLPEEPIPFLPEPQGTFQSGTYSYVVALAEYDAGIEKSFDPAASRVMDEIASIVHARMSRMISASVAKNPHASRSAIVAAIRERFLETIEHTLNRLY